MKKEVQTDFGNTVADNGTQMPNTISPSTPVQPEMSTSPTVAPAPQQMPAQAPVGTPTPKSNGFGEKLSALKTKLLSFGAGPIIAVAVVAVVLVALVVFKVVLSSPKAVFKGVINQAYKQVDNSLDIIDEYSKKYDIEENAFLVNMDVALDSNVAEINDELGFELKDLKVGAEVGFDLNNEVMHVASDIKGSKETLDVTMQVIEDKIYMSSSLFDEVIAIEEETGIDFGEIKETLKQAEEEYNFDTEDYKYIVKSFKNALNKSLNSKYMEKESAKIEIADKKVSATKYSYILEEDSIQELVETLAETLLDDSDFIKKLADISGTDKSEIKDTLKELKKSAKDIEFEEEIALNIYTKGLFNKLIGFSVEYEGDEYVTLFVDGKNAELVIDNQIDDEYSGMKIVATITEEKKTQKLVVKYNGEKIVTGTINELSDEVIDMELTIIEGEEEANFAVYLSAKEEETKVSGDYKLKISYNDEYVSLEGAYGFEVKDKLSTINTKNAVGIDEVDSEKIEQSILEKIEKDEVLNSIYELGMEAYEEEYLDLNYYGMLEISESDVSRVLTKSKATVLYVGDSYYSYSTQFDAYSMFYNLQYAQTDLDFYSYYLDSYYMDTTAFEELVKDVEYVCATNQLVTPTIDETTGETVESTPTCENYPAIYLIKDGKVQKAFRGYVSSEDLETALKEIGIG